MRMKISEALKLISTKERGRVHQTRSVCTVNRLEEIFELIKKNPGIKQCELHTHIKLHPSNFCGYVLSLCAENRIERIHIEHTYKLYIKGTIQNMQDKSSRPAGCWQENSPINKAHGEAFFKAFEEAFNLPPIIVPVDQSVYHGACNTEALGSNPDGHIAMSRHFFNDTNPHSPLGMASSFQEPDSVAPGSASYHKAGRKTLQSQSLPQGRT